MQPTMPMQQWQGSGGAPPGGGAGSPPGGQWGPPPMGGPPMGPPPAPPKKSGGMMKWLLGGCGCLIVLGACIGGGVYFGAQAAFGTEHTRFPIAAAQPFSFQFATGSDKEHAVWMQYDVAHSVPWSLGGSISVSTAAGAPLKTVQLTTTSTGATTNEGGARMDLNSSSSSINGNGSASGQTRLFTIPAQPSGTTLIVSGTVMPAPGTTLNSGAIVIRR